MHIEFLVEGESCKAALEELVPKIVPAVSFGIHPHQGKPQLLRQLPARLRGYRQWLPADWRVAVVLDADTRERCKELKATVERIAREAGFHTKSRTDTQGGFEVVTRLAVEELEAWFFGDADAVRAAYPRVPGSLEKKAPYRDPDGILGGTWEALERVLQRAGYHKAGLPKITAARAIAGHMDPARNRSRSFRTFQEGLLALAGEPGPDTGRRPREPVL